MMLPIWMNSSDPASAFLLCAQAGRNGMSIYLRGDVWYYLFYIHGRRYRGSTKTKNQKQAERVEARKRVAAETGESLRQKRVPLVREFAREFVEWLDKTTLAENTKNDYKNGRRLILKTPLSGMRMDQITADDVETTKFHESPHSRNSAIRTLRRMLGKARDWKVLREAPRIKTVKVFPRDRMVTVEDERRLLEACKRPLKDVLTIMLDSGLRNGEVVRMRWETIHWEGAFYFNPRGKTRKARRPVPLSERVLALLKTIQLAQSSPHEGWVFPSKKSRLGHIGLSGLEHSFRKIARKLGIPDALKLYCARHTFGTVAMAETKNPGLVKEVMGHESLSTTMGYLHPETAEIKVVIDRLNQQKQGMSQQPQKQPQLQES
jgi:integrase